MPFAILRTNDLTPQAAAMPDCDYIVLAGIRSPGVCRFTKPPSAARNWDVRQGYGYTGAYAIYTGMGLHEFSIAIDLWEGEQFREGEWLRFAALLGPPKPAPPPTEALAARQRAAIVGTEVPRGPTVPGGEVSAALAGVRAADLLQTERTTQAIKKGALAPVPPRTYEAMAIVHPRVNMPPWNITAVVVKDVYGFTDTDEGLYTTVIDFLEYKPPQPGLPTKPQSETPDVQKPPPTARDAAEVTMVGLVDRLNQ